MIIDHVTSCHLRRTICGSRDTVEPIVENSNHYISKNKNYYDQVLFLISESQPELRDGGRAKELSHNRHEILSLRTWRTVNKMHAAW